MFKSVNRVSVLKCLTNDGLTFSPRKGGWIQIYRCSSGLMPKKAEEAVDISCEMYFTNYLQQRQDQARRSFYATFDNLKDCEKLFSFCKGFGPIHNAFHYEDKSIHYLLIEMSQESYLNDIIKSLPFNDGIKNQFMALNKGMMNFFETVEEPDCMRQSFISVTTTSSQKFLNMELSKKVVSIEQLIKKCYECLRLGEFDIRKKFLLCRQLEVLCSGFLPGIVAFPFGSSVSGFGISGCDLDVVLLPPTFLGDSDGRGFSIEQTKVHLAVISDILRTFNTWSTNVLYIKNARVPIVKFRNRLINVECDLSMYNPHGVAMTQMLYALSTFDWRVKALVVFIKLWSLKVGISNKIPPIKLSSFSVTALVLFFLQQIQMLPPLNIFPCKDSQYVLQKGALISESVLLREKLKCTKNKSVEELFKMFNDYYSSFNFQKWGISLRDGKVIKNTDNYPLFIENPIYEGVNASANVRSVDILEAQSLFSAVGKILNSKNDQNSIRKIFALSVKKKKFIEDLF